MPPLPLRIAILECDTSLDDVGAKCGSYDGVYAPLLKAGAGAMSLPGLTSTIGLEISTWDVVTSQEYPNLEDIDTILITGSRYNAFDNHPWIEKLVRFAEDVLKQTRARIVGVCFGIYLKGYEYPDDHPTPELDDII